MTASVWNVRPLAEFVAALASAETEDGAALAAVERAAEALDADVAAIVCGGDLIAAVGYPDGTAPVGDLEAVKPGVAGCWLDVPGVGACPAAAAALEHPPGAQLIVARPDVLTLEETGLLRGMAWVASLAMRLLRALDDERAVREDLERLARQQATLRRVATLVAQGGPPDDIFAAVAEEVARFLGADHGSVVKYEPDESGLVVAAWTLQGAAHPAGTRLKLDGGSVTALVRRAGRPARVDDYEPLSGEIAAASPDSGIRSAVGAPIVVDGRLWGAMIAASNLHQPFPAGSEEQLAAFTELVATAISNAHARRELAQLADEQAALRRVATLVARSVSPAEVFAAVTEEVGRLIGAEWTSMSRSEASGESTVVATWRTEGATEVPPAGETAWRSLLEYGAARQQASCVVCPIVVAGKEWGAILASPKRGGAFAEDVEAQITDFTELVGTAILNAASRSQLAASRARIVATADETRRRIERDLHDGIQQRLVTLSLELGGVEDAIHARGQDPPGQLRHVEDELREVLEELREIARGVHPAILSEGGLALALKTLARRSSLPVVLQVAPLQRLPQPVEVAAYYVVSEALTNATKHANASTAYVGVDIRDGTLHLSIRDDGVGGADPARGSGIVGLIDRVEAIGGTVAVRSTPDEGTAVVVQIPTAPP